MQFACNAGAEFASPLSAAADVGEGDGGVAVSRVDAVRSTAAAGAALRRAGDAPPLPPPPPLESSDRSLVFGDAVAARSINCVSRLI